MTLARCWLDALQLEREGNVAGLHATGVQQARTMEFGQMSALLFRSNPQALEYLAHKHVENADIAILDLDRDTESALGTKTPGLLGSAHANAITGVCTKFANHSTAKRPHQDGAITSFPCDHFRVP